MNTVRYSAEEDMQNQTLVFTTLVYQVNQSTDVTASLNDSGNTLDEYELIWTREVIFRVTTIIVTMVMTLLGNITLIVMIMSHRKQRRKRVNIFLLNLAIGDLMVCFVTMTTEILFVAFGEWVLGSVACKVIVYGQIVTLASATFLLTGMSIDRYQVIVQPLQSLTGQPKIWRKVLLAWIFALIFAVPQLFIFVQTDEGRGPDGRMRHMCKSKGYTAQWQRKLYFTFLTMYILIIPTIIMSFCYSNIIKAVWRRTDSGEEGRVRARIRFRSFRDHSRNNQGEPTAYGTNTDRLGKRRSAVYTQNKLSIPKRLVSSSKRNVVKMTLSVIIGFLVCWTPYFVVSLIRIYSNYEIKLKSGLAVAEVMALIHSALNPILYGMYSTRLVRAFCRRTCRECSGRLGDHKDFEDALSEEESTWTGATKIFHIQHTDPAPQLSVCAKIRERLCRPFRNWGNLRRGGSFVTTTSYMPRSREPSRANLPTYQELYPHGQCACGNDVRGCEITNSEVTEHGICSLSIGLHRLRTRRARSLIISNPEATAQNSQDATAV